MCNPKTSARTHMGSFKCVPIAGSALDASALCQPHHGMCPPGFEKVAGTCDAPPTRLDADAKPFNPSSGQRTASQSMGAISTHSQRMAVAAHQPSQTAADGVKTAHTHSWPTMADGPAVGSENAAARRPPPGYGCGGGGAARGPAAIGRDDMPIYTSSGSAVSRRGVVQTASHRGDPFGGYAFDYGSEQLAP